MKLTRLPLGRLKPAPYNPRVELRPGDPVFEQLRRSLETFGVVEPIVWNRRTGHVVGGHQRLEVLRHLGHTHADVMTVDLTLAREKTLNLALNKITGSWDDAKLAAVLEELGRLPDLDVSLTGFAQEEIDELLARVQASTPAHGDDAAFDVAAALDTSKPAITRPGELLVLGHHRLLCGDCTNAEDVRRVMDGQRATANVALGGPTVTTPGPRTIRCAIYTRKSTEEGLNQEFNSLDAQRESAIAYIASQKNEGWRCISEKYDDGGFTGGNIERPALKRLMDDIKAGKVDCVVVFNVDRLTAIVAGRIDTVVVYKVDRLSRSLADFARLMQTFDEQGVSFVSVTQQFNTTTSMGRLTLNMLLSFAQFEREVAGERIRDKLAATFKRGVFVTGQCTCRSPCRALLREPAGYQAGLRRVPDQVTQRSNRG